MYIDDISRFHELRKAQVQLIDAVKKSIENAYEFSQSENTAISDGPYSGQIAADSFFDDVNIDSRMCEVIRRANAGSLKTTARDISFGQLLRDAKSISNAKEWIRKTDEYLRSDMLNHEELTYFKLRDAEIDYTKELYHCLELVFILVRKSKKKQRNDDSYFLEYCALCWRLVHKQNNQNLYDSTDYSTSYCLVHHPKKSVYEHKKARAALISAVDKSDHEMRDMFIRRKNDLSLNPRILYRATAIFSDKPSRVELEAHRTGNSWVDSARLIIEISKIHFPRASVVLNAIPINKLSSWKEWFYAVINSLDSSGTDKSNWEEAWGNLPNDQAATSLEVGENVLLNIIHRYESANNIKNMKQPRGPKAGSVPKNDELRASIIFLAAQQMAENNKIDAAEIGRKLNKSRERIRVLLKELGIR